MAGLALIVTVTLAAFAAATSVPILVFISLPVSRFEQDMRMAARDMPTIAAREPREMVSEFLASIMTSPEASKFYYAKPARMPGAVRFHLGTSTLNSENSAVSRERSST